VDSEVKKIVGLRLRKSFGAMYDNLLGDVLLSSGVIAYLGPFTLAFRDQCIAEWIKAVKVVLQQKDKTYSLLPIRQDHCHLHCRVLVAAKRLNSVYAV
jgi:hypothetical protein